MKAEPVSRYDIKCRGGYQSPASEDFPCIKTGGRFVESGNMVYKTSGDMVYNFHI